MLVKIQQGSTIKPLPIMFNSFLGVLICTSIILLCLSNVVSAYQILTIGDSITRGSGFIVGNGEGRRDGGFQPYLEDDLSDEGIPSAVYNWGVSGDTTYDGLQRINSVLNTRYADFILIMFGANDLYEGISSSTTAANLSAMISRTNAKEVTPIVSTITPNSSAAGYDSLIANSYNPKIAEMTEERETRLADQYAALRPEWDSSPLHRDGLHPNSRGHHVISETYLESILGKNSVIAPIIMLLLNDEP